MSAEGREGNGKGTGSEARNRIEGVTGATGAGAAPDRGDAAGGKRPDVLASFFTLPPEERILAGSSLLALVAFGFARGWTLLFRFGETGGWFFTFALLGGGVTLALLAARRLYPGLLDHRSRDRAILIAALLPTTGLVIELLGQIWAAVMIVGALGMARGAYRIDRRDHVFTDASSKRQAD